MAAKLVNWGSNFLWSVHRPPGRIYRIHKWPVCRRGGWSEAEKTNPFPVSFTCSSGQAAPSDLEDWLSDYYLIQSQVNVG